MLVDLQPGVLRWAVDVLWSVAVFELLIVVESFEDEPLQLVPPGLHFLLQLGLFCRASGNEPGPPLRRCEPIPNDLERYCLRLPPPEALPVHCQELQENRSILLRIVRGGHEKAQNRCSNQNQGLATPPFSQSCEGLTIVGLSLLVAFFRDLGDGKLRFNEGNRIHAGFSFPSLCCRS